MREGRGWSKPDLASILAVTSRTVANYELTGRVPWNVFELLSPHLKAGPVELAVGLGANPDQAKRLAARFSTLPLTFVGEGSFEELHPTGEADFDAEAVRIDGGLKVGVTYQLLLRDGGFIQGTLYPAEDASALEIHPAAIGENERRPRPRLIAKSRIRNVLKVVLRKRGVE